MFSLLTAARRRRHFLGIERRQIQRVMRQVMGPDSARFAFKPLRMALLGVLPPPPTATATWKWRATHGELAQKGQHRRLTIISVQIKRHCYSVCNEELSISQHNEPFVLN